MKNPIKIIDLNGAWAVRGFRHAPDGLPARVPGCIHEDLFGKGTNMIPTSPYGTCRDPGRYRVILERAANEHLNLIRIWGGGIYEIGAFYDLCDEMGFVVWQDFMFACSGYPLDEPEFLANVCEEAREYGFQSMPDAQTWDTCLAEGDDNLTSPMVDFHQRGTLSWFLIHVDGRVLATGGQEVVLPRHKTLLFHTFDFKAQLEDFDPGMTRKTVLLEPGAFRNLNPKSLRDTYGTQTRRA